MIKEASVIIRDSFGKYGKSYRIGGDEFCVLLDNENPQSDYGTALEIFNQLINHANQNNSFDFKIHIAQGFSICKQPTSEKIKTAIRVADHAMYENKAKLKEIAVNIV